MTKDAATVYVIHDQPQVADLVRSLISPLGLPVSWLEATQDVGGQLRHESIGCLLFAVQNSHFNSLRLLDQLNDLNSCLTTVLLTEPADVYSVVLAAKRGAVSFFDSRLLSHNELVETIQRSLLLSSQRHTWMMRRADLTRRFARLSTDEEEIIALLLEGVELYATGTRTRVNRQTIERQHDSILRKVGVDSLGELLALAVEYERYRQAAIANWQPARIR